MSFVTVNMSVVGSNALTRSELLSVLEDALATEGMREAQNADSNQQVILLGRTTGTYWLWSFGGARMRKMASKIASATGHDLTAFEVRGRGAAPKRVLHMSFHLSACIIRASGGVESIAAPDVDPDLFEIQESEPHVVAPDESDLRIWLHQGGSPILHACVAAVAEGRADQPDEYRRYRDDGSTDGVSKLPDRLAELRDEISYASSFRADVQADGRYLLRIEKADGRQLSFLSADEFAQLEHALKPES